MDTILRDTNAFIFDLRAALSILHGGMAGVSSSWSDAQFEDLQREVTRLVQGSALVLREATELEQTIREVSRVFGR